MSLRRQPSTIYCTGTCRERAPLPHRALFCCQAGHACDRTKTWIGPRASSSGAVFPPHRRFWSFSPPFAVHHSVSGNFIDSPTACGQVLIRSFAICDSVLSFLSLFWYRCFTPFVTVPLSFGRPGRGDDKPVIHPRRIHLIQGSRADIFFFSYLLSRNTSICV